MPGIEPPRVLVTRPEPGAAATARRLEACGFVPLLLPLSRIEALPVEASGIPADVAAVAVTSANALRHLPGDVAAALADRPCFCVGDATAEAARSAGFSRVVTGPGDAGTLAATIAQAGISGPLLYLAGRLRRPDLEDSLVAAGIAVTALDVYDTLPLRHPIATVAALFGGRPVEAALVYSSVAAEALAELTAEPTLAEHFERTRFFCMSKRIAGVLGSAGRHAISCAAEPTEDALIALLCRAMKD